MADTEKKVIPLLPPKRIQLAEYVRSTWRAVAEEGHTKEQILDPTYWAHAAQQVKRGDLIEVVNDTETFFMELYVQQVGKGFAKVIELRCIELIKEQVKEAPNNDYEVVYKGPSLRYCVVRKEDGEKVKTEMEKDEANLWLKQYLDAQ
jgi:hypothetical protein